MSKLAKHIAKLAARPNVRGKILLPFGLLAIAATVVTAMVAISLATRALDARLAVQLERVSAMVSDSGFALNRPVLERLKAVLEADVVTLSAEGVPIVATVAADSGVIEMVRASVPAGLGDRRFAVVDLEHRGHAMKLGYRALREPAGAVAAFVMSAEDIHAAARRVTRTILVITGLVVALVAVVSRAIARSLTAPIEDLAAVARRLGRGDREARATRSGDDEIGSLATAFNDMADRLRDSEARRLETERLAAAGRLAAGVAHDIRNPLSSMKMHVQLLRARLPARDPAQETVGTVLRQIERIEWVVRGLLDLARPGTLDLARVSPADVVAEALDLSEPQLAHLKIAVERRFPADVPRALIDAERMTHALLNLILNASEAMPGGGTLVASAAAAPDGRVVIEIADDGTGVDPAVRDRVFEPFVTTKRDGVGLGLVNARAVVEQHGGTLRLLAREGGGTRAVVVLPPAPPQ